MARSTPSRASDSPRDAIALLKQDHRTVEALFDEFESADEEEQSSIAERVCQLLTIHAQIEEEILYPEAMEALEDEEDSELVHEAQVEHASAKDLIAKIEGMAPEDDGFRATVKVLGEYVKHHVKEEEGELFPKLKKAEIDLKDMGSRLADRKFALMEQIGIQAEEPAPARKRATAKGSRAAGARARQARAGSRRSSRSSSRATRH